MKKPTAHIIGIILCLILFINPIFSQNPFVLNLFTADPSARVFGDNVYVFPSHDIANQGKGRENWFCMEDYHVFSSSNLTEWKDHGVILSQENVEWVDASTYTMWAPDCIEKNGKYYFYFPAISKETSIGRTIGVAIADSPSGPYTPQKNPIANVKGIDPNVFIDKDGQAYLYWSTSDISGGNIFGAKLSNNMTELSSEVITIEGLPTKGLIEGPWLFEKDGFYYMTYPHVNKSIERIEYAMGKSPLGPFETKGVIMDESPTGCWTNHHSIINFNKQWYFFYHNNDLSPQFDKNRAIKVDSLFFNDDGSIQKITPTVRGVGLTLAAAKIQIDRYSKISNHGASIAFIDSSNTLKGWKTILSSNNAWIQYNGVDFEDRAFQQIQIRTKANAGGTLEIRLNSTGAKVLAKISVPQSDDWIVVESKMQIYPKDSHNLVITNKGDNTIEFDWLKFVK